MSETAWFDLGRGPLAMEWRGGCLPAVEEVPYDAVVVLWSRDYIGLVKPHGDALNPLRWCDGGGFPRWGIDRPCGHWAWVCRGSQPRPPHVKTWDEMFPATFARGKET